MAKEIQFILYNLPDNSGTVQACVYFRRID